MKYRTAKKITKSLLIGRVCSNDFKKDLGSFIMSCYSDHVVHKAMRRMGMEIPNDLYKD